MLLCLQAGALIAPLAASAITLAWTHSVERTAWEEDWRASEAGLVITQARVRGSGAGIDPPEGARREGGFYVWEPRLAPVPEVVMRRSGATADWRVCTPRGCRPIGTLVPPGADPVVLRAC